MAEADIILHVRDIAHEESEAQKADVETVLTELGFRTRTHAVVYVLAREISARSKEGGRPPSLEPRTGEDAEAAEDTEAAGEGTAEESA